MRNLRGLFWMMLAAVGASVAQPAWADQIYDGMTFAQFKAILSTTSLELTEKVTPKGNGYYVVVVPGTAISFLATMTSCDNDVNTNPCDGFSFIAPTATPMSQSAMSDFNRDMRFVKARVSPSGNATAIVGEYYARGVTDSYVRNAGAFFTTALLAHLGNSSVTSMNEQGAPPVVSFASPMPADKFFAALAQKGGPKSSAGARDASVDVALVDSLHGRGR